LSDFAPFELFPRLDEAISLVPHAEILGQLAGSQLSVLVKLRAASASIAEEAAIHAGNALHHLVSASWLICTRFGVPSGLRAMYDPAGMRASPKGISRVTVQRLKRPSSKNHAKPLAQG
jgi:hypothetical protein